MRSALGHVLVVVVMVGKPRTLAAFSAPCSTGRPPTSAAACAEMTCWKGAYTVTLCRQYLR